VTPFSILALLPRINQNGNVSDQNRALLLVGLLALVSLMLLWMFSAHGGTRTRTLSQEMEWSTAQLPSTIGSPEQSLAPLPKGGVRLRFGNAPNTYVVVDYPGLLENLERLGKRRIPVEFDIGCGFLKGGAPYWFTIRSIAGWPVQNLTPDMGWVEGVGKDVDPFRGACDWW
jgi:hypothetical protein